MCVYDTLQYWYRQGERVSEEKGPVVVQSVGDPHHLGAGVQTDGRLCGQQQFALKQQLVLLVRGERER